MTAKELYEYLGKQIEAQSKFGDLEVVVVTTGNYLNVRSYTKVTNVSKGMYWEIGRLNITTEEVVSKVYVANPINETPIELKSLRNPKNPE